MCSQVNGAGHAVLHRGHAHLLKGGSLTRRGGLVHIAAAGRGKQLIGLRARGAGASEGSTGLTRAGGAASRPRARQCVCGHALTLEYALNSTPLRLEPPQCCREKRGK